MGSADTTGPVAGVVDTAEAEAAAVLVAVVVEVMLFFGSVSATEMVVGEEATEVSLERIYFRNSARSHTACMYVFSWVRAFFALNFSISFQLLFCILHYSLTCTVRGKYKKKYLCTCTVASCCIVISCQTHRTQYVSVSLLVP